MLLLCHRLSLIRRTMASYVAAIDQGTSSTRCSLVDSNANIIAFHQSPVPLIYPKPGWVEQDPMEILRSVQYCMDEMWKKSEKIGVKKEEIKAVGITNQRETTVVWDKNTGLPLYNAISWQDTRNGNMCIELSKKYEKKEHHFTPATGLPIATYFSALKLLWLIQNQEAIKNAIKSGTAIFGTVDTWLTWKLTGGKSHVTDVTNASRTMLMNLQSLDWDLSICRELGIDVGVLPKILSSSEHYGTLADGPLANIPITACVGDQHAALIGQYCFKPGDVKNTYGTGSFVLYNIGSRIVHSDALLTTVAYKLGKNAPVVYALEGSIAVAGQAVQWLRDNMQIISDASQIDEIVGSVRDSDGMYFVPGFNGLFAPYWRHDATAIAIGLKMTTTKAHFARAVLEAAAYQTYDVIEEMNTESGLKMERLLVDGGLSNSNQLLQTQADLLNLPVLRPDNVEATTRGAALAAGLAVDIYKISDLEKYAVKGKTFAPQLDGKERDTRIKGWKKAIQRSLGWYDE